MTAIRTRFTSMVGTDVPVVQAGMSWASSNWQLPLAVSEAGGLGVLAAGPMRPIDLEHVLREIRAKATRPWAVNLPLYRKDLDAVLPLLLHAPPPVLIASQGGPRRYLRDFHAGGTICLHVVANLDHARKAVDAGVDGLVVVGGEAGGHPPPSNVSSLILTRLICRELPEIPVVASGGFADGYGLAAALAMGASAVQFGTRFLATHQARVHPAYQRMVLDADAQDAVTVGRDLGQVRVLRNRFTERMLALENAGAAEHTRRVAFAARVLRSAAIDGDVDDGKVEAGQSAGLIDTVEDARDVVDRIATEYAEAIAGLDATVDNAVSQIP